jgi:(E)-4-hydroxy-3-methylbut-2-enyl-diphosphate synthase
MNPASNRIQSSRLGTWKPHPPERKETLPVSVGDLIIGDRNPVVVQEMTSTPTSDIDRTLREVRMLSEAGCRLIRVAVPDEDAARALAVLKRETGMLLVADIHFDYRLALRALEAGVDKLRLNPGTMGSAFKVKEVVAASRDRGVPIRVGVNSGSLQRDILERFGGVTAEGLVESALREVALLEKQGFQAVIVSIKSPDIGHTVQANRLLSERLPYPLHIGITEAGPGEEGIMRSVVGLGTLLLEGIGDTVRVSLTHHDRVENIGVCRRVLNMLHVPFV